MRYGYWRFNCVRWQGQRYISTNCFQTADWWGLHSEEEKCKGSRAWDQFRGVLNPLNDEEVFGVACCCICKVCILYKRKVSGEERSLGTKNMLDHMKRCLPACASAHKKSDAITTSDIDRSSISLNSSFSSASSSFKGGCSSSTSSKAKRPSFKTLNRFFMRSGKKVGEGTRKKIHEEAATLVAAAHLPYRFVEQEALKDFASIFYRVGCISWLCTGLWVYS